MGQNAKARRDVKQAQCQTDIWTSPKAGWLEVNFDGALLEKATCIGLTIRNCDGDCMFATSRHVEVRSVDVAELIDGCVSSSRAL